MIADKIKRFVTAAMAVVYICTSQGVIMASQVDDSNNTGESTEIDGNVGNEDGSGTPDNSWENAINTDYVEGSATLAVPPEIVGKAAILMDADTGAILYAKDAYNTMYPASITKIMTALLTIENCSQEDIVTYPAECINQLPYDASRYGVVAGEQVTVRDSLYMLLLRSANEVAIGLAMHVAGSEAAFGEMMTERAKQAGALNTQFTNASGLHQDTHYTTAYDMAMIAKDAIKNTTFAQVWGSPTYTISPTNKVSRTNTIWHTHQMLVNTRANYYSYAKAGKTGYTNAAGRTLITYASKNGMNLICVVMKSTTASICSDTRALFEYGFDNFKKINAKDGEIRFGQASDSFFIKHKDLFEYSGALLEIGSANVTIPSNADLSEVGYYLEYPEEGASNILNIKYYIGDNYLGKTSLTLNTKKDTTVGLVPDKKEPSGEYVTVKEDFPIDIRYVAAGVGVVLVIVLVVVVLRRTKDRRRIKRERKKLFKNSKLRFK